MFFARLNLPYISGAPMLLGIAVLIGAANASLAAPSPISIVDVVLLAGQSNADGRAPASGLPPELRLDLPEVMLYAHTFGAPPNSDGSLGKLSPLAPGRTQFPSGGFGPEIALGHTLAAHCAKIPGRAVAIIKYAKGGSSLYKDWHPGGDSTTKGDGPQYVIFQRVVRDGMAALGRVYPEAEIRLAAFVWVQGETDIANGDAVAESYAVNLANFVADVRQTFMSPTLPFLFNRLSANQQALSKPASKDYPRYLVLRERQNEAASKIANVTILDTDGPDFTFMPDQLHYSAAGQMALGKTFGVALTARIPSP